MYSYQITPSIQAGLGRLIELKARLDSRGPLPRIWLGRTRRELEAEAVAASTAMEGVAVTVDEVRRILAGDRPSSVAPQDVAFVEGYRDAMKFVLNRADDPQFGWQSELIWASTTGRWPRTTHWGRGGSGRARTGSSTWPEGGRSSCPRPQARCRRSWPV